MPFIAFMSIPVRETSVPTTYDMALPATFPILFLTKSIICLHLKSRG